MPILIRKRLTRWGNGYGIRLTKAETERLNVQAGDELEAEIFGDEDRPSRADLDRLAIFDFGGALDGIDLDELAGEDAFGDL